MVVFRASSILKYEVGLEALTSFFQTLTTIASEHNSTIVFPVPVDLVGTFLNAKMPYLMQGRPETAMAGESSKLDVSHGHTEAEE